jgi:hypothetical protein
MSRKKMRLLGSPQRCLADQNARLARSRNGRPTRYPQICREKSPERAALLGALMASRMGPTQPSRTGQRACRSGAVVGTPISRIR